MKQEMKHAAPKRAKGRRGTNHSSNGNPVRTKPQSKRTAVKKKKSHGRLIAFAVLVMFVVLVIVCAANSRKIYRTFVKSTACPADFTIKEQLGNKIKMTWSTVKDADGYKIYKYNPKSKEYAEIADLSKKKTSYKTKYKGKIKYAIRTYKNVWFWQDYSDYISKAKVQTVTDQIECIGHRGSMDEAPQNTMASFKKAYENGYKSIETDFWETNSGDLMIMHDKELLIMCGLSGTIRNISKDNYRDYPIVKGTNVEKYNTQYIPTVEEVVKNCSKWNMNLYLHVKYNKMSDDGIEKLISILDKYDMKSRTTIFTANQDFLVRLVQYDCISGFLKIPENEVDIYDAVDFARDNGADVVILEDSEFFSKSLVNIAHNENIRIGCYDANTIEDAFSLIDLEADFLITNNCFFK